MRLLHPNTAAGYKDKREQDFFEMFIKTNSKDSVTVCRRHPLGCACFASPLTHVCCLGGSRNIRKYFCFSGIIPTFVHSPRQGVGFETQQGIFFFGCFASFLASSSRHKT